MGKAYTETLEWKQLGVLEEQRRMECEWRETRGEIGKRPGY